MQKYEHSPDEELVSLSLHENDMDAFAALIGRYEKKLSYYMRRLSSFDEHDIEDLLQETFLNVWKNLNAYDPSLRFSTWVYRIAHNQTISAFRKYKSRGQDQLVEYSEEIQIASAEDFVKELDQKLSTSTLLATMQQLKPKYREVLVLKYFEDLSYDEISDVLQMPPGSVATLLSRAKKKLKPLLQQHASHSFS